MDVCIYSEKLKKRQFQSTFNYALFTPESIFSQDFSGLDYIVVQNDLKLKIRDSMQGMSA